MPPGWPCFIWKCRWKFPCEHPFYLTAKIMNRVVFLQRNPATEQHGVTFLWMGSAVCCTWTLWRSVWCWTIQGSQHQKIQDYLYYFLFIWLALIEFSTLFYSVQVPPLFRSSQSSISWHKPNSLFHFIATVSGSSHASSLWGAGLHFHPWTTLILTCCHKMPQPPCIGHAHIAHSCRLPVGWQRTKLDAVV